MVIFVQYISIVTTNVTSEDEIHTVLQAKRAKLFRLGQKLNSILFVVYSLLRPDTNKYVLLG